MKSHKAPGGTVFFTKHDGTILVLRKGKEVQADWTALLHSAAKHEALDAELRRRGRTPTPTMGTLTHGPRQVEVPLTDVVHYVAAHAHARGNTWPPQVN